MARLGFEYAFVDIDTARFFSGQAIDLSRQINFKKGEARGLNNLAISYDIEGDYEQSLKYFLEALSIYETLGDKKGMAGAYSNCGMVYHNLQQLDKSLEFHLKSFGLEKVNNDSIGIAYSMLHIAGIYLQQDNFDQAIDYYNNAGTLLTLLGETETQSYVHIGLGELYVRQSDMKQAEPHLLKALDIFKNANDQRGQSQTYVLLATLFQEKSEFAISEKYYNLAIERATQIKARHILVECFGRLSEMYEKWGQYDQSLAYFKKYKSGEDSLLNEQKLSKIERLQQQYTLEKKEKEIQFLNKEKDYQATIRNIIILILAGVILLVLFIYRLYLLKIRAFKDLEEKNRLIERKNFIIQVEKQNALQASEAKAQFLSNMSHEIRTPLNAIIGLAHLLEEKHPSGERKENLKALSFSAQNLLSLVNDVLDFSKIEAGKMEFNDVPFNLVDLVTNIRQFFQPALEKKNLKLKVKLDEDIPSTIIGDPSKLSQVITNLVNNSIKFTEQGSVTIDVELADQSPNQVVLEFAVADTGIGIPVAKQKEIFKSFSQADRRISDEYGGTGLGLAIVKKLLQQKGSEIYVESRVGRGSRFYFQMSFKISAIPRHIKQETDKASFKTLEGLKVLLAEDDKINEMLGVKLLTKWGVDVDVAQNGIQAIEMAQIKKYDIILMDIQMPEMDGFEATKIIRELSGEVYKHIPILALTAAATTDTKQDILACGMNDFIYKPYNPNDLYNKIEQFAVLGSKGLSINKI